MTTKATLTPGLARAVRDLVRRDKAQSPSTPAPQKIPRHPRSTAGSTVRRGKTTTAVTPLVEGPPVTAGMLTVQLYKPDAQATAEWDTAGDPIDAENWSSFETTTTGLWCQVAKDAHGRWTLLTINCEDS